jgi:pimeloyl-ACP methyl ester carboxylesterase
MLAASSTVQRAARSAVDDGKRRTFVLVHGSWHGGWCWKHVSALLCRQGHRVLSPTLTGLGERRHLLSREVDLTTHILDVANVIETNELDEVILVGHSYGGVVIAGAADRLAGKLSQLIFLDALLIENGQSVFSRFFTPEGKASTLERVRSQGGGLGIPPPPATDFGITDAGELAWVSRHLAPQPVGTYEEPLRLHAALGNGTRKTYVECSRNRLSLLEPIRQSVHANVREWRVRAIDTGHDAMVSAPAALTTLLCELAG